MTMTDTEKKENVSEIQSFYRDKTIFITGGTGFLGNILLDKLLRSCSDLKRIYILTREKKGKDPKERFKQIFDNVLFDKMKTVCPDYTSKVSLVTGDCKKPNLGLNQNDRNILICEVEVVFHAAATVRFDAPIRDAVNINVRATRDLMNLAISMKQLKAFVHVSTAYSNCAQRSVVEEQFYTPPITPEHLIMTTNFLSDQILERITPPLIKPWPNTYAYTKAIAEDVIRTEGKNIPTIVVRPSIVIATAAEPIPGWINNYYGPTGIVAGAGLGLLRTVHADKDCLADLVPCDKVVNAIVASAWDISNIWAQRSTNIMKCETETKLNQVSQEIPILNFVSSNACPLKWKDFMKYNETQGKAIPPMLALWVYCLTLNKFKFIHQIYCIFLHLLPALIVDTGARIVGKEPRLWSAYEKIHKFSEVISYFSTKQWKFHDSHTVALCDKLSAKDKELFHCDLRDLNWENYFYHHIRGLRVYLIHDPMDTVKEATKKQKRLLLAHYALKTMFYGLVLYIAVNILKWIFQIQYKT